MNNKTVLGRPPLEIQGDLQQLLAKLQSIEHALTRIQRGDSNASMIATDALAVIVHAADVVARLEDEVIAAVKIGERAEKAE